MNTIDDIFKRAKAASRELALLSDERRNEVLRAVAQAITANTTRLLEANALDLARMDKANPLYDRLQLTADRLGGIASDMVNVSRLPSPLGRVTNEKTLPNGLRLRRVSVPFGVIGMIYEARPNVTFDVFSLCFKSGNACVLKGGDRRRQLQPRGCGLDTQCARVVRRQPVGGGAAASHTRGHQSHAQRRGPYRPVHTAWR